MTTSSDGAASKSACHCPSDTCRPQENRATEIKSVFRKYALCAGSGVGGLLAGHAGCIATPLALAAAGVTTAAAGASGIALAFSAAATAGGIYLWRKLRGQEAGKWEKRLVIASAATGVALSSVLHYTGGGHDDIPSFIAESVCRQPKP